VSVVRSGGWHRRPTWPTERRDVEPAGGGQCPEVGHEAATESLRRSARSLSGLARSALDGRAAQEACWRMREDGRSPRAAPHIDVPGAPALVAPPTSNPLPLGTMDGGGMFPICDELRPLGRLRVSPPGAGATGGEPQSIAKAARSEQ
jgi:hypothetical protein